MYCNLQTLLRQYIVGLIHTLSKNLYSNPSEVFDTIIEDEKIERRSKSVTNHYDELIETGMKYQLGQKIDEYDLKEKLWRTLVTVNILEGLRFYVSFACSFAFVN